MRVAAGRPFLDTNVLVYSFMPGDPSKREKARRLVTRALEKHDGRTIRGMEIRNPFR